MIAIHRVDERCSLIDDRLHKILYFLDHREIFPGQWLIGNSHYRRSINVIWAFEVYKCRIGEVVDNQRSLTAMNLQALGPRRLNDATLRCFKDCAVSQMTQSDGRIINPAFGQNFEGGGLNIAHATK